MSFKQVISTFLSVVLLTAATGACFSTYQVPPQELYKLNGFREGQTVIMSSVDGDAVKFNSKTDLKIEAADGQSMNAKYSSVNIDGQTMTGVIRGSGAPVNIDLGQVVNAEAKSLSVGKTVGLGVGLGVGIPVVILTVALIALFATANAYANAF